MKRTLLSIVLIVVLVLTAVMPSAMVFADEIITPTAVLVNNTTLSAPSVNVNGVIYSPASELIAALGGNFTFDSASYSYLTSKILVGENEVILKLDSNIAQVNGKYIPMPAPMRIISNRIMVPTAFISQTLGAQGFIHSRTGATMIFQPQNNNIIYTVQSGDSLWRVSQIFGTTLTFIQTQNNLTTTSLYVGQKLIVAPCTSKVPNIAGTITTNASLRQGPNSTTALISYLQVGTPINIIGKTGNWYRVTCSKGTGYVSIWVSTITQDITYTAVPSKYFTSKIPTDTSQDTVSYVPYTVVKGDNVWTIAQANGIPDYELRSANNLTSTSVLSIGQVLQIPVHNIAVRPGPNGLESLDWFSQANYVFPIGKVGKLTDIQTGKSFMAKRTMGANHSDTETLTVDDTAIMKDIFGGNWTWARRPFILEVDGRRFAVSVAGMPHAGVDGVPYNQMVDNRSDNYGYGPNLDAMSGNGMDGHFDMYFYNGLRHKDNQIDPQHQLSVSLAAGLH